MRILCSLQGVGYVIAAGVAAIVLACFKTSIVEVRLSLLQCKLPHPHIQTKCIVSFLHRRLNAVCQRAPPMYTSIAVQHSQPASTQPTHAQQNQHMLSRARSTRGLLTSRFTTCVAVCVSCLQYCQPGIPCKQLDDAWRICVAVGAIPAIATWYLRSKLPETPRFTVHVAKDTAKAEADVLAVLENSDEFRKREKAIAARGTGLTWREFNDWVLQRRNLMVSRAVATKPMVVCHIVAHTVCLNWY